MSVLTGLIILVIIRLAGVFIRKDPTIILSREGSKKLGRLVLIRTHAVLQVSYAILELCVFNHQVEILALQVTLSAVSYLNFVFFCLEGASESVDCIGEG